MDNQKKEYAAPELKELGEFSKITQSGWVGDSSDGVWPEDFPEQWGS